MANPAASRSMQASRLLPCILLAVVMLLPTPLVGAQHEGMNMIGDGDNTVVITDPVGDVELTVFPKVGGIHQNASQVGQGQFDHVDITKVMFGGETEKSFQVALSLKALDPPSGTPG